MASALSFKEQVSAISLALRNPNVDLDRVEGRVNALWSKIQATDPDYTRLIACRDQVAAMRSKNLSVNTGESLFFFGIFTLFWNAVSYLLNTIYSYTFCCGSQPEAPKPPAPTPIAAPQQTTPAVDPVRHHIVGPRRRYANPAIPDYTFFRQIDGNGDCFYSSYTVSFLRDFIHSPSKDTFIQTVRNLNVTTCPQEKATVLLVLELLKEEPTKGLLYRMDRDNAVMTHFVKFFRHAAAHYLLEHADDFHTDDTFDMRTYCNLVKTMGKSTMGNYEIVALSQAMGWGPRMIQTDGTVYGYGAIPYMSEGDTAVLFSPSLKAKEEGTGHYDIIYRH